MKVQSLEIKGFRSLKEVLWEPGDLNVVIGPNGSGKSNLLRFLELIVNSAQVELRNHIQRTGGIGALVWDGIANEISYKIIIIPNMDEDPREITEYEVLIQRIENTSEYCIGSEYLIYNGLDEKHDRVPKYLIERKGLDSWIIDGVQSVIIDMSKKDKRFESPKDKTILSMIIVPFSNIDFRILTFRDDLTHWAIYHDIDVSTNSLIRQPSVVTRYEKTLSSNGENLINVLHTLYSMNRNFKERIDAAMLWAFGEDYEELIFSPAADQRIQLRVRWKTLKRTIPASDLSDGTLRYLFLITALSNPSPPPLIAIDEPETGLHPSMFPVIAEYAAEASKKTQVIFTTHSPDFLSAFKEIQQPTVTVTLCEDGQTILKTIDGEELKDWLKEYSLGSLFQSGELEGMI